MNTNVIKIILRAAIWINMIVVAVVLFFTIAGGAMDAALLLHAENGKKTILLYGLQVVTLLLTFFSVSLLQRTVDETRRDRSLLIASCTYLFLTVFTIVTIVKYQTIEIQKISFMFKPFISTIYGVALVFFSAVIFFISLILFGDIKQDWKKRLKWTDKLFLIFGATLFVVLSIFI